MSRGWKLTGMWMLGVSTSLRVVQSAVSTILAEEGDGPDVLATSLIEDIVRI